MLGDTHRRVSLIASGVNTAVKINTAAAKKKKKDQVKISAQQIFQSVICDREASVPFSVLQALWWFLHSLLLLLIISIIIIQNFLFLS